MISEGSLQDFSFSDLLQIISLNGSTGTLKFSSEGREGLVECRNGEISGAAIGETRGEEAVYSLFNWATGHFWFAPDRSGLENIHTPMADLAKEGIRRLDLWKQIEREMPGLSSGTRFAKAERPSAELSAAALEVYQVLDKAQSLGELAIRCGMGELGVAQALLELGNAVQMHHTPAEASRILFKRLSEGLFERFASISGLKMTEGLEALLNDRAREGNIELRWRNGQVQDGLVGTLSSEELLAIFKRFIDAEMDYIGKMYPASFTQRALAEIAEGLSPEERECWTKLGLPLLPPLGVHS